MKLPSQGFLNTLQIMDAKLNVRWGNVINQWVIERLAIIPETEVFYLRRRRDRAKNYLNFPPEGALKSKIDSTHKIYLGTSEETISAERGYRIILFVRELSPKVFDLLALSDITRYGGYSRFADELEADESRKEIDAERVMANKRNAISKETFDMLNFIWRKKEDALLNGHRDLRYLLHGEHTTEESKPLIQLAEF